MDAINRDGGTVVLVAANADIAVGDRLLLSRDLLIHGRRLHDGALFHHRCSRLPLDKEICCYGENSSI